MKKFTIPTEHKISPGWKVDQNFFNSLEEDILEKTLCPTDADIKTIPLRRSIYYKISGIAASVVLLVGGFYYINKNNTSETDDSNLEMYLTSQYLNMPLDYIDELSPISIENIEKEISLDKQELEYAISIMDEQYLLLD